MELRPFRAVHREPPYKERRPALWIDRQVVSHSDGSTTVVPLLIGLLRVAEKEIVLGSDSAAADAVARRVGALVSVKADAEPCLLITRAPLEAALATSRPPDAYLASTCSSSPYAASLSCAWPFRLPLAEDENMVMVETFPPDRTDNT